jgi:hypothetical protein
MFGVYCIIMSIVLVNMFIAMMSNSYQIIANQADEEWKVSYYIQTIKISFLIWKI